MANKLNFQRVFIKDTQGNHYRIFSITNPKDAKGESYLKIVTPDTKDIPLITGEHNKRGIVSELKRLSTGVHEFSYHYRSGVSHFKDSTGHIDSEKGLATLFTDPALHLIRFVIRSLEMFEVQNKDKITKNDFVLPIPFDGKARGFELAVSKTSGGWNVINTQGNDPVHTYHIPLNDPNVTFHIADCIWVRPPIAKGDAHFEFFRYKNPTNNFEFKSQKA